jgi:hypothetical protein
MSIFRKIAAWVRLRLVAAQWRAEQSKPHVTEGARRCIANHKQRVRAAISRNHLDHADELRVLHRSDALVDAYLRGKISTIDDVTVWTLNLANKLGNAAATQRLIRARGGSLGHTSFLAR